MSLMINQNITSLNAWRNLGKTDRSMSSTMEKLSSGLRINRAADDPSGLVISEQMRAQVVGLKAAIKNSEKGVSLVQTAEAALDKVHGLLDKMRGLALDSANSATSDANMLAANQAELSNILDTITRISENTQYGTKKLLDGSNSVTGAVTNGAATELSQVADVNSNTVAGTYTVDVAFQSAGALTADLNGTNMAFSAANATASTLAVGTHTVALSGQFEQITTGTDSTAGTGSVQASGSWFTNTANATSENGEWTVTLQNATTGGSQDFDLTAGGGFMNFTVTNAASGMSYTFQDVAVAAGGNFTLASADADVVGNAADDAGAFSLALNLSSAVYANGESFTINVTASTAQATLNGDAANASYFNSQTTMSATADITDGTNTAQLNMSAVVEADFIAGDTATITQAADNYTAQLTSTTSGAGALVTFQAGDTGVTVADAGGTNAMDLDFGATVQAGTSTVTVADNSLVFQVGANQGQTVKIGIRDVATSELATGVTNGSQFGSLADIRIDSAAGAQDAILLIDKAIDQVSTIRGDLGAFQANTLEANLDNLRVASENLQASESTIRDTDMAAEMATFTKYQIMMQAGTAMLAQANQIPNNILQLLR